MAALLIWGLPGALVVNLVVVVWSETVVKVWLEGRTFVLARLGFNAALPTIALAAAWLVLRLDPGDWLVWLLAGAVFEVVTVVVVELHTLVNGGPARLSRSALMLVAMCATEIPLAAAITVLWLVNPLLSATMAETIFVAAVGLHYILEFIELRDLVQTDHRTGLLTPTAWRDSAERTLRQQPLAILMADLDHFKRLNDSYGHLIGDSILQQVGNILLSSIRPVDLACRWGGEEFVLMLVGTTEADAVEVAERIRRRVGAEAVSNGGRHHHLDRGRDLPAGAVGAARARPDRHHRAGRRRAVPCEARRPEPGRGRGRRHPLTTLASGRRTAPGWNAGEEVRARASEPLLSRGSWPEARRLTALLRRETVGGVLLIAAATIALVWANSPAADSYFALRDTTIGPSALHLDLTVGEWAADGLLAIFFFVAGLELKREFVVGDLRDPSAGRAADRRRPRRHAGAGGDLRGDHARPARPKRCAAGRSRPRPTSRSPWPCSRWCRAICRPPCGRSCSRWRSSTTCWRSSSSRASTPRRSASVCLLLTLVPLGPVHLLGPAAGDRMVAAASAGAGRLGV